MISGDEKKNKDAFVMNFSSWMWTLDKWLFCITGIQGLKEGLVLLIYWRKKIQKTITKATVFGDTEDVMYWTLIF